MGDSEPDIKKEEFDKLGRIFSNVLRSFLILIAILFSITVIINVLARSDQFPVRHFELYLLLVMVVILAITFLYGSFRNILEWDLISGAYISFMGIIVLNMILIPLFLSDHSIGRLLFIIGINLLLGLIGVVISMILHRNYKQKLEEHTG